jgi:CMP-N,N'-diacetyllegionaminic acid synthase
MKQLSKDSILTIIPARAGSKRLKDKNIRNLAGKPLIQWTIDAALHSKYGSNCYVSTDCENIAKTAKRCGAKVPFLRPIELAKDTSPTFDAINHMINNLQQTFDYLLLLQPTSPLRTVDDIDNAIQQCINSNAKAIISVTELDPHVNLQVTFGDDKILTSYPTSNKRTQELESRFILNGAIYFSEMDYFLTHKGFLADETMAYIMDRNRSIDIDTNMEFQIAELILKNNE